MRSGRAGPGGGQTRRPCPAAGSEDAEDGGVTSYLSHGGAVYCRRAQAPPASCRVRSVSSTLVCSLRVVCAVPVLPDSVRVLPGRAAPAVGLFKGGAWRVRTVCVCARRTCVADWLADWLAHAATTAGRCSSTWCWFATTCR